MDFIAEPASPALGSFGNMKGAVAAASKGAAALFYCGATITWGLVSCKRVAIRRECTTPRPRCIRGLDTRWPMLYFVKPIGFTVFSPRE